ncbi:hypothetical protein LTR12_012794 [Friedmanniomyces endolithicus]|nr:hypothetical protein LTR12_012794 [Friedmanniomyces endolithicus]
MADAQLRRELKDFARMKVKEGREDDAEKRTRASESLVDRRALATSTTREYETVYEWERLYLKEGMGASGRVVFSTRSAKRRSGRECALDFTKALLGISQIE